MKSKEEKYIRTIRRTLGFISSMIRSGENHTIDSETSLRNAFTSVDKLESLLKEERNTRIQAEIDADSYGLQRETLIKKNKELKSLLEEKDSFAIGFATWVSKLSPSEKTSVWSKNGEHSGLFTMDNEQLLDKYKRYLKQKA